MLCFEQPTDSSNNDRLSQVVIKWDFDNTFKQKQKTHNMRPSSKKCRISA